MNPEYRYVHPHILARSSAGLPGEIWVARVMGGPEGAEFGEWVNQQAQRIAELEEALEPFSKIIIEVRL